MCVLITWAGKVSTHSRLKAAGLIREPLNHPLYGFNTQPPEGGWWDKLDGADTYDVVSTHSRLKAAGRRDSRVG